MPEHRWYHKGKGRYHTDTNPVELSRPKLLYGILLILGVLCVVASVVTDMRWGLNASVPMEQEYTNYLNAAHELYDPLLIVQTLERALQGIENLGLRPTDSGAIFSWNVNYYHTVEFNIDQINSVIAYGYNVIEWKEQSYYNNTIIENVNDVYNEKVVHLRDLANNPNTHNIKVAYCFNNKPEHFWYPYTGCTLAVGLIVACAGALLYLYSYENEG